MGWSESVWAEMQELSGARRSVFIICVTMLGLGFGASQILNGAQITTSQTTVKMLETENALLREKLAEKPPPTITPGGVTTAPLKMDAVDPKLSDAQLASLNTSLKASRGAVEITTGEETPKTLTLQVQGAFVSNGWTVKRTTRRDTFAYLWIEPTDSDTSDIVKTALKNAKIKMQVITGTHSSNSLLFSIDTPVDPYDRDQN